MADKKISALTAATTPLAGTEVLPIVQGGSTVKVAVSDLTVGRAVSGLSFSAGTNIGLQNTSATAYSALTLNSNDSNAATRNWAVSSSYNDYGDLCFVQSATIGASPIGGTVRAEFNNTNGNFKLNTGNLVVGTAGKGIDFSANTHAAGMTSELLDWYEEGTWTPTDASGAGLSFVAVSGNYTRIGNTVFLFGYVRYPVTATTNTARIGGLPFTANSADSVTQGAVTYSQVATIRSVGVAKSTAILDIYTLAGGVPTNADLSNTVLYFNSTYFV